MRLSKKKLKYIRRYAARKSPEEIAKALDVPLKVVKEAGEEGLAKASEEIRRRLQAMKEDEAVGEWLQGLRAKAEIKVFEEHL